MIQATTMSKAAGVNEVNESDTADGTPLGILMTKFFFLNQRMVSTVSSDTSIAVNKP